MSNTENLLEKIETFEHDACKKCPWAVEGMAFGISCPQHHFNWKNSGSAKIMSIGQDPGGTTPEHTQILCAVCNSKNPSDGTASGAFDLMKAAILDDFEVDSKQGHHLLKEWYVTNALKHGIPTSRLKDMHHQLKAHKESAQLHCSKVLKDEILAVHPELIIAVGTSALKSLQNIGAVQVKSQPFKNWVDNSPHISSTFYPDGSKLKVFCIYHSSKRVTNQTVSKLFNQKILDEINELKAILPRPETVVRFLRKYDKPNTSGKYTTRNGMYVHLLHQLRLRREIEKIG